MVDPADDDESLMRKFALPEEDRLAHPTWPQWNGGHRWFRSANVVDLQDYRSQAEKQRICVNLLLPPGTVLQDCKIRLVS